MKAASEYIAMYGQGIYTRDEIVSLFIVWAAERALESFVLSLPAEFVAELRKQVEIPPSSTADVFAPKCGPGYIDAGSMELGVCIVISTV